jgi:hypothetical protein
MSRIDSYRPAAAGGRSDELTELAVKGKKTRASGP